MSLWITTTSHGFILLKTDKFWVCRHDSQTEGTIVASPTSNLQSFWLKIRFIRCRAGKYFSWILSSPSSNGTGSTFFTLISCVTLSIYTHSFVYFVSQLNILPPQRVFLNSPGTFSSDLWVDVRWWHYLGDKICQNRAYTYVIDTQLLLQNFIQLSLR